VTGGWTDCHIEGCASLCLVSILPCCLFSSLFDQEEEAIPLIYGKAAHNQHIYTTLAEAATLGTGNCNILWGHYLFFLLGYSGEDGEAGKSWAGASFCLTGMLRGGIYYAARQNHNARVPTDLNLPCPLLATPDQ